MKHKFWKDIKQMKEGENKFWKCFEEEIKEGKTILEVFKKEMKEIKEGEIGICPHRESIETLTIGRKPFN